MKASWEVKTLGDVCVSASSNISQNKLANNEGDYPIYGASGLIKKVDFYHQDKPYLSIVKDGSGFGRVSKMDAYTSVIGTLQYILPKEDIDLDYLNYSLMSVDFKKYVAGAAIPHIYFKDYKNEPFLWMPLSEQKRIVAILDEAFEAIARAKENTEQNLKNAKEIFESYLQLALTPPQGDALSLSKSDVFGGSASSPTNKGDALSSSKSDALSSSKSDALSPSKCDALSLSKWEEKKLGEVCEVIAGQSPEGKFYNTVGEGVPFYQGKKEYGEKYIGDPKTWTTKVTKEAHAGDILMSVRAPVGPINFATQKICIGRGLASIRAGDLIDKEFLFYFLNNKEKELEGNSGAVFNSINKDQIKQIPIPLPPLPEQQAIVHQLDTLRAETQKLEVIYTQKLNDLEELKKSLLQKAFAGELVK